VVGDRGYDAEAIRRGLRARRIMPWLAKRNTEHGQWTGPMAVGGGANLRLAQSVPSSACALWKAGWHAWSTSGLGVRCRLLEGSAKARRWSDWV